MRRKLFCDINPTCYKISLAKEVMRRNVKDILKGTKIAKTKSTIELPNIVKSHSSILIRKLHGVDIKLQENKVTNIILACQQINGTIIHPGETFSFWKTVGKANEKKGYKKGLIIVRTGGFGADFGGGLCQMANMIHWLVLHSPLQITELHHHTDALFPDERRRVPFGTGTSISYATLDYRFKNTSNQDVQLLVWVENGELCGELRSEKAFPYRYKLVEENHHYKKDGGVYFRNSQVYRIIINKETKKEIKKELVLNNHSKVLYDYDLIPKNEIREDDEDVIKN